jgi:hypothetical protein
MLVTGYSDAADAVLASAPRLHDVAELRDAARVSAFEKGTGRKCCFQKDSLGRLGRQIACMHLALRAKPVVDVVVEEL